MHRAPRTTLFSPVEVPDDPPPIDIKNIEVLRTTKPLFASIQWPEMNVLEDAWSGNPSDARSLQSPSDGSTLTWTGETCFERVRPPPPKGKTWCMGDLVNVRRGTQRADDVHPLQWWILSEAARRDAAAAWKTKSGEILRATNRRSIPRVPLENMPPSTITIPTATTAMVSKFLVSEHITTAPADIPATTSTSSQSVSLVSLYQEQDWTLPSGSLPSMNEVEDYPPELVDESSH